MALDVNPERVSVAPKLNGCSAVIATAIRIQAICPL
jgi:hypothetical protein